MSKSNLTRRQTLATLGKGAAFAGVATLGVPAIVRAQSGPIKLGFLSGLTGLETILGETQLNCFELAVSQINAASGIAGRRVEFIVEDDQTTTKGAIEKARKLINQKLIVRKVLVKRLHYPIAIEPHFPVVVEMHAMRI